MSTSPVVEAEADRFPARSTTGFSAPRRWCARPGCRHAPSRHESGPCSCGCPRWAERWPHWWRELAVDTWWGAEQAWWLAREAEAVGYETEMAQYAEDNPRPTFKAILIGLAGSRLP